MNACVLLGVVLAALATGGAGPGVPSEVLHPHPGAVVMGRPLPVSVVLSGVSSDVAAVSLHYRPQGAREFELVALSFRGQGTYGGVIPASATANLSVSYYIEAAARDGTWRVALGSPGQPFHTEMMSPPEGSTLFGMLIPFAVSAPFVLLAGFLWLRERRRRHAVVDQIFWVKSLVPLLHLPGPRLSEEVSRLAQSTLDHPVHGPRQYRHPYIVRKLEEIRALDLMRLADDSSRYLGQETELPPKPAPAPRAPRGLSASAPERVQGGSRPPDASASSPQRIGPALVFARKAEARKAVWDRLAARRVPCYPYPPHGHTPGFAGGKEAALRLFELPLVAQARCIGVTRDLSLKHLRRKALEAGMTVFFPTAGLREGFGRLGPNQASKPLDIDRVADSEADAARVLLGDLPTLDVLVVGSVAVTPHGQRVGKGDGYADLLYAILRELGLPPIPIVTLVHPTQIVESLPLEAHDLPVVAIATPEGVIRVENPLPAPAGIDWDLLSSRESPGPFSMLVLQEVIAHRQQKGLAPL